MNILLINPQIPKTFWGFHHALKFIAKRASLPPLGLLTVAAMLPSSWNKRLVDANVTGLSNRDILWADLVFIGGMSIQQNSARQIIATCKALGRRVVAGGPLFTAHSDQFEEVDHLVLNEAELTLPRFLEDLRCGQLVHRYETAGRADVTTTPPPLWGLINPRYYSSMSIQYSRGCPYDCEFCDITVLYGRVPRTKTREQLLGEFESLYRFGWRGGVFLVDDNFIGNRQKLKKDILPGLIDWMKRRRHPFDLYTEASINLADDDELMHLMVQAGFHTVFVGIESPDEESLAECKKIPNRNRDLIRSVKSIQHNGMQVQGGFIVGFDSDAQTIFRRMTEFIQESGIVTAMVGLLNAPVGSKLYRRLAGEGRLLRTMSGDNTDFTTNIVPRMGYEELIAGYRSVLEHIYAPKHYYARLKNFLSTYKPRGKGMIRIRWRDVRAFVRSTIVLGLIGKERVQYWKLFFWSLFTRPRSFPLAITLAIYGFHFRKVFEAYLAK